MLWKGYDRTPCLMCNMITEPESNHTIRCLMAVWAGFKIRYSIQITRKRLAVYSYELYYTWYIYFAPCTIIQQKKVLGWHCCHRAPKLKCSTTPSHSCIYYVLLFTAVSYRYCCCCCFQLVLCVLLLVLLCYSSVILFRFVWVIQSSSIASWVHGLQRSSRISIFRQPIARRLCQEGLVPHTTLHYLSVALSARPHQQLLVDHGPCTSNRSSNESGREGSPPFLCGISVGLSNTQLHQNCNGPGR